MQTQLLRLPLSQPNPNTVYGVARLNLAVSEERVSVQDTPLSLLPRATRQTEIVALVPAHALSWHRVTLPPGLGRARAKLQAALQGLLEDRLLQDSALVHFALAPQWRTTTSTWVAACDKAWLQAHLQTLHEAGLPVQRIVPEFAPPTEGQNWHAVGDETYGWLWCADAQQGVSGWPVAAAAQLPDNWLPHAPLHTEAALVRWAQARYGDHMVTLADSATHWRLAASSDWNLAQFELQTDARTRHLQRLRQTVDILAHHPQWRAARWGLAAFLLSQLVGLQAWAWMTRQQWQAEQDQWTQILQQSFPKVSVVLDAPLQMAREVAQLRQASGQLTAQDLELQLQALGTALPTGVPAPSRLDYQEGQLQWPDLPLSAEQQAQFEQVLQRQGLRLSSSNGTSRLQVTEGRP